MCRVQFDHNSKVLYGDLNIVKFLVGTSDQEIRAHIAFIDVKQAMAVLDGLNKESFFHEGTSSNKECFSVCWVDF